MSELTAEIVQRGTGAPAETSVERRRLAQEIRATRERLTSSSGLERAFDYELLRQHAQHATSFALANIAIAACASLFCFQWLPPFLVTVWVMLVCLIVGVGLSLSRRFLTNDGAEADLLKWRRIFSLVQFLQGVVFSFVVLMVSIQANDIKRIFVFVLVLVLSAVVAMLSYAVPMAVFAGLTPVLIIVAVAAGILRDIATTVLLFGASVAVAFFALLAVRQYRSAVLTLEFRAEKDALIAELEQARTNSDEARRRAEDANLAKSKFLATMSHELRTPLNAILGFSEVMKNEVFGAMPIPAYKEYVADIHGSGQHLLNLINEILDLSRIEAGRYELKEEAIALAHIVEECRHLLNMRAKSRGLTIKEMIEPQLAKIWADERAVRQIVLNLLSNAIKFTPQGGEITLKVGWTASGGQYVSVRDNGHGIPENEIPTVLSTFGRGSMAIKTAEQGSGLGLPIVKGLMDLHGGNFTLTSKLREGTEVVITFPAQRIVDAIAAIKDGPRKHKRVA